MVPIPMQMLAAACLALVMRAHLPMAVAGVWVTNPLTIGPVFYFNYRLGTWIHEALLRHHDLYESAYAHLWQPLILGSLVVGTVGALVGYFAVLVVWSTSVRYTWRQRRDRRQS